MADVISLLEKHFANDFVDSAGTTHNFASEVKGKKDGIELTDTAYWSIPIASLALLVTDAKMLQAYVRQTRTDAMNKCRVALTQGISKTKSDIIADLLLHDVIDSIMAEKIVNHWGFTMEDVI